MVTESVVQMQYQLEAVWPSPSEAVRDEVVAFWLAENAIPDVSIARQRAHQLIVVARDEGGKVAGVSTAVPTHVDQLGFDCFYYRTFVSPENRSAGLRSTGLARRILQESYHWLHDRFCEGCDSDVLGLYMEIENEKVMRHRNDAVWQENGMNVVYIGQTSDGRHIRVWYFDGARVPRT